MIKIPLTQGKFALIDGEDYCLVSQYKWFAHVSGRTWYAETHPKRNSKVIKMHQLLMGIIPGIEIDHKDGNGLNNQRYNLRRCTHAQNLCNKKKYKHHDGHKTASIHKGLSWDKKLKKWYSRIQINSKRIYLGHFISEIEAAEAYNKAALEKFGEFANFNKIK